MKGKRKRGRQKQRCEGNIKDWTGLDFASSTRAAENRSRWKGVVANLSVTTFMGKSKIELIENGCILGSYSQNALLQDMLHLLFKE